MQPTSRPTHCKKSWKLKFCPLIEKQTKFLFEKLMQWRKLKHFKKWDSQLSDGGKTFMQFFYSLSRHKLTYKASDTSATYSREVVPRSKERLYHMLHSIIYE